jgi:protein TonB
MRACALAVAAALVAGCGAPPSPPPEQPAAPAPPEAAQPQAAPTTPQAAAPKLPPPKTPLDAYKREVAQRILDANAARTFTGQPPHMLRAVVVLQLTIDGKGKLTQLKTLRTRDGAMAKAATESIRAAAPLPAPPSSLLRKGTIVVAETWLFRDDGKFQVRSLAEAQPPAD